MDRPPSSPEQKHGTAKDFNLVLQDYPIFYQFIKLIYAIQSVFYSEAQNVRFAARPKLPFCVNDNFSLQAAPFCFWKSFHFSDKQHFSVWGEKKSLTQ